MLKFLSRWKFSITIAVIAAGVIGYLKLNLNASYEKIERLDSEIISLQQDKQSLQKQMAQYEKDIINQVNKNNRLEEKIAEIDRERRGAIEMLNAAKGRQEVVWRKPELVQRLFRRNWKQRTDELSCVMGVTEKCE